MAEQPEPWLRGPLTDVPAFAAPTLHAYQQAREDLTRYAGALTPEQLWFSPPGVAPVGFHLKHIAGSVDRLTAYLKGQPLTEAQMAALRAEREPTGTAQELLQAVQGSLARSEHVLRGLDESRWNEARTVGRQKLPTTVIGLVVHLAEHTMRHVGQAITTAQLSRQPR